MIISEIGMGSVAHRSGTLVPGDRILSVNNNSLQDCSLEQVSPIIFVVFKMVLVTKQIDTKIPI